LALINCPECGREVSDQAEACPRCAYPIAKKLAAAAAGLSPPMDAQGTPEPDEPAEAGEPAPADRPGYRASEEGDESAGPSPARR
jgi:hypothetical protein